MKLASRRPFGEQKPARRATSSPRPVMSLVNWPCRKFAASAPTARMTPQSVSAVAPSIEANEFMPRLSSRRKFPCARHSMRRIRYWRFAGIALVVIGLAGAGSAFWWLHRPLPMGGASVEVDIELGTSPRDIAAAWVQSGVQTSPTLLYEWFRWSRERARFALAAMNCAPAPPDRPAQHDDSWRRDAVGRAPDRRLEFPQFRAELAKPMA